MSQSGFLLKDKLFNTEKINTLAQEIKSVFQGFDSIAFVHAVVNKFPELELKERIEHVSESLINYLPANYPQALDIILKSLPQPLDETLTDNDFGDFIYAPYGSYVVTMGCNIEHLDLSLGAIREITKRFSMEYAIRPFINRFPNETMLAINDWCQDKNYHVRRLCSEGSRPKLPWGIKINLSPDQQIEILNKLYFDTTRYVTRSVANHLNDISKSQANLVIETLKTWSKSGLQTKNELNFITKHTLRTLVKQGNPDAMDLLGFSDSKGISIHELQFTKIVWLGEELEFQFSLRSDKAKAVVVDYIIYFQNKNGGTSNRKVFKLKSFHFTYANQGIQVFKKHPLRIMTTRKLCPGLHTVEIQVNGSILSRFDFHLIF
jgi:3-methyladenine DNA glycosylase AlkC